MANYDLGEANGRIRIESDTSGVDDANESLDRINRSAQTTEQALDKTGNAMGVAGAAIAGGLGLAVNTARNFEQGISNIAAVAGLETGPALDAVRDKALQIGADTSFGATEAAQAMEELVKAGLSVDEVLGGAADATVALAAAGGVDMPTAATIASNAMNQFGLTAEDMVHTVDLIAGAANASAIDVTDLGMSMSQVGAVANLAGLSFEETAVAIAEMGNAGIKGSDAGTSLKTFLSQLQPTTNAATTAMEELGLITEDGTNQFYDASGSLKDFADVQELLHNATADLTDAQKQQYLETIFGSDAIRAAAVIANEGAAGYTAMNDAMLETSAADVAAARQDNLNGSIEKMKGAFETAAITVGDKFVPAIRSVTEWVGQVTDKFNELSPEQQKMIAYTAAIVGGLFLFGSAMIKTVQAVQSVMEVMRTLRILSTATQASFITTAAKAVWSWVTIATSAVVNAAKTVASWGLAAAQTMAHWARMAVYATVNAAKTAAAWVVTAGMAAARAVAQTAVAVASMVAGWIVLGVQSLIQAARVAAAWFIALGPIGWAIAALIALVAFIIIFWDDIKAAFGAAAQWVADKLTELWNNVVRIWNDIIGWFQKIPGWIGDVFSGAASWLVDKGRAVLQGLWNGYIGIWGSVLGWLGQIGGWVIDKFAQAGSWLVSAGGNVVRGLWNGIQGMASWLWNKVTSWASDIVDGVLGALGIHSPSIHLIYAGEMLTEGLSKGIEDSAAVAINSALDLADNVLASVSMTPGGSSAFWDASAIGQGYVPPSPEVASYAASQGSQSAKTYEFNTYNPVAERASDSVARRLRGLASLGAFGGEEG